eukprot:2096264-Pyramimonas_sp.AAC.1
MEPHELMSTGIITKLKGQLVYDMSEGTCRGITGNYSVRDYFIVSESLLENGLRAEVMTAFAAKPRRPIRMKIGRRSPVPQALQRIQKVPWPLTVPTGCPAPP